jgi:uncharacterized protein YbjT (DUF2867 family)
LSVVLVTGGTGLLGHELVPLLREAGHDVRVLSRRQGAGTHVGDLGRGEGIVGAAAGAELVVHAASGSRGKGRPDLAQTRHLLAAAGGVRHLLYVSVVGCDAVALGYYQRKLACEREVGASGVRHTILRATQFHELMARGLRRVERVPLAPLPLDWRFQLVAAWRERRGRPRAAVHLPLPGRVARGFRAGRNTCPDRAVGRQTWAEFLAGSGQ